MLRFSSPLLYVVTLFSSAFLLFWVEPLLGKLILPVFGGAPATWNVCILFFQAALLGGYLYAHAISSHLPFRLAAGLHVALLLGAAFFLPDSLHEALVAQGVQVGIGSNPGWKVIQMLSVCIGLPFFFLSATSSLTQSWFGGSSHARARDPYFLYAASNLGSLLALLVYPWLIEPFLPIPLQWRIWKQGYLFLALLVAFCALWRDQTPAFETAAPAETGTQSRGFQALGWMFWSFVPSSLLLGVTSYLSTDMIAVPLLWTLPLVLYLGSFVFVFGRPAFAHWATRRSPVRALCIGALLCVVGITLGFNHPTALFMPLHLLVFTLACIVCLGRLATTRPPSGDVTRFYFWLSLGGVLGGVFNGFIAPVVFNDIVEYPLMMIVACLCRDRESFSKWDLFYPIGCLALVALPIRLAVHWGFESGTLHRLIIVVPAVMFCFQSVRRPLRYSIALGVFISLEALFSRRRGKSSCIGIAPFSARSKCWPKNRKT